MKTTFKTLSRNYVAEHSDMVHGINGRDAYVDALKRIVLPIKSKEMLSSINKIKQDPSPRKSFHNLIDWMVETYPKIYLYKDDDNQIKVGFQHKHINDNYRTFPCDWLVPLRKEYLKLENLAVKVITTVASKMYMEGLTGWGQLYNEDYALESANENVDYYTNQRQSVVTKEDIQSYREYAQSLAHKETHYDYRFIKDYKLPQLKRDLKNFQVRDYEYQPILDMLKGFLDLALRDKSLNHYDGEAFKIFCEDENVMKDEQGNPEFNDGHPLMFGSRFLFVWTGEDKYGTDHTDADIQSCVQDILGNFGGVECTCETAINEQNTFDDALVDNMEAIKFFTDFDKVYTQFNIIRDSIMLHQSKTTK